MIDTAVVAWEPLLVENFEQPAFTEMPPNFMQENFKKQVQTVREFVEKGAAIFGNERTIPEQYYQEMLITGLKQPSAGKYSVFHENALYVCGYGHPTAVRLGYM